MADFLGRNWGNLASVAGLVFSALAFVFSKRASTAAQEARDAAMRQSMGGDMDSAVRTANEIVTYLRTDKADFALLRIADLAAQTSYLIGRWDTRLSKKSKDNLSRAHEHLLSMHEVLSTGASLTPDEKARLASFSQRISGILSEEHGAAIKAAEIGND